MAEAIELAGNSYYISKPNPRVGCVLVRDGQVVARGWTQHAGGNHAEIEALQRINHQAKNCVAYVTLEPCCHTGRTGPCTEALIRSGVRHVVAASEDPNPLVAGKGLNILRQAGITVESGILEKEAWKLNPGFLKRMTTGLPRVTLKLASTLDGRTADHQGKSQWITGVEARKRVHEMRASSCAVVTGIGSVVADNPRMNARVESDVVQPLRVVVDSHCQTPVNSDLFNEPGPVVVACNQSSRKDDQQTRYLEFPGTTGVDLAALVNWLAAEPCNEVMVEAGPRLSAAFLKAGLVDRVVWFQAPRILGEQAAAALDFNGAINLDDAYALTLDQIEQVGDDLMLTYSTR